MIAIAITIAILTFRMPWTPASRCKMKRLHPKVMTIHLYAEGSYHSVKVMEGGLRLARRTSQDWEFYHQSAVLEPLSKMKWGEGEGGGGGGGGGGEEQDGETGRWAVIMLLGRKNRNTLKVKSLCYLAKKLRQHTSHPHCLHSYIYWRRVDVLGGWVVYFFFLFWK